jgi:hypothetical protein
MVDAGVENPHGAENSAVKNTAPLNLALVRISENASIHAPGLPARFSGVLDKPRPHVAARASDRDARA